MGQEGTKRWFDISISIICGLDDSTVWSETRTFEATDEDEAMAEAFRYAEDQSEFDPRIRPRVLCDMSEAEDLDGR